MRPLLPGELPYGTWPLTVARMDALTVSGPDCQPVFKVSPAGFSPDCRPVFNSVTNSVMGRAEGGYVYSQWGGRLREHSRLPNECRTWEDPEGWERPCAGHLCDWLNELLPRPLHDAREGFPPGDSVSPAVYREMRTGRGHAVYGHLSAPQVTTWYRTPLPGLSLCECITAAYLEAGGRLFSREVTYPATALPETLAHRHLFRRRLGVILTGPREEAEARLALACLGSLR